MDLEQKRRTLARPAELEGLGLHSGIPATCRILPGEAGIRFICGGSEVEAVVENVKSAPQRTQLGSIHTVEHLLAAFVFCGITDAVVELSAPEVPGMDGSAALFVEALMEAGTAELPGRRVHRLFARVYHIEDGVRIAVSAGEGRFRFVFDTGSRWPGRQEAECLLSDLESCRKQIAPARTLAFEEDVEKALAAGLGRGLGPDSCLVLGASGYVNQARFPNEPARHKLLDLIGDLSLAGYPLEMLNVTAEKSGHRSHREAALKLRDQALAGEP